MILPKGYKRVQYIQSDGTAYIDSGRVATDKTKVEIKAHGTFYSAIAGTYRFGVYYVSGSNRLDIAFGSTGYLAGVISGINYPAITTLENGKAVCNGVEYIFAKQAAFTTSGNLPLFGNNSAGACHYYKWHENGVLVREFVPCINASGVIGMFDMVEQKFYGNAGGGSFTAGPIVPEQAAESEIVELEYIESSGTQYIDTGFKNNQDSRIVMGVQVVTQPSSHAWVFGARNSGTSGARNVFLHSGKTWTVDYNSDANRVQFSSISPVDRVAIDFNKNVVSINGETHTFAATTFQCNYNHILFAQNDGGSVGYNISARLYSCQIYDNGLLVRDYIPAKTIEGEVGLYDRVFKEFYRNAGTGTFVAGPEMQHENYTELEYVQSDEGHQYTNTGIYATQNTRVVCDAELLSLDSPDGLPALFGFYVSGTNQFAAFYNNSKWNAWFGSTSVSIADGYSGRKVFSLDSSAFKVGDLSAAVSSSSFTATLPIHLFGFCQGGTHMYAAQMKLFVCSVFENGLEIRIYIPMLHPSGVAGLWDAVNERFYASASTMDFIAGPVKLTTPKTPANFRVVSESDTEVSLAWDASENAAGYLVRQSGAVIADTAELTATAKIQPFGYYTFEVSAYNEYGESERSTLAVFRTPDNPMLWLVTDRTAQDVTERNSKGVYTAVDLNRVGAAADLLKILLESAGFIVNVFPKLMWKDTEWMNASQAEQYLADIQTLRTKQAVLPTTPETPETMARLNYTGANHIEQILLDVYTQYLIMLTTRVAAGTATSGGDYL